MKEIESNTTDLPESKNSLDVFFSPSYKDRLKPSLNQNISLIDIKLKEANDKMYSNEPEIVADNDVSKESHSNDENHNHPSLPMDDYIDKNNLIRKFKAIFRNIK